MRDLLDSLYQGYPVGYLIAWRNPTVRLKDGTASAGKRILIEGMYDELEALMSRKDYKDDGSTFWKYMKAFLYYVKAHHVLNEAFCAN